MKLAICAALIGLSVAPAGAQRMRGNVPPEVRADRILRSVARCALDRVPATARKVLDTPLASDAETQQIKALLSVSRDCFGGTLPAAPSVILRTALAEASYQSLYTYRTPPSDPARAEAKLEAARAAGSGTPLQLAAWYMAGLGNCIVAADSAKARALVLESANSDEENRRFADLQPAVTKCSKGAKSPTVRQLRGFVAEALLDSAGAV